MRDRDTVPEREHGLQLAMSGDREALGRILESYMPQLYRAALRILGKPQDAEEALQDALVQVVLHFGEFEGRSRFSTWLTRIVINAALMRLRRRRPEVTERTDHARGRDEKALTDNITDPRPNPEQVYAREEQVQLLRQKLMTLPSAYRSALWLRHFEGLNTREAAAALGIPVGSVKSQLHRARSRLRADLDAPQGAHKTLQATRREPATNRHRFGVTLTREVVEPAA